MKQKFLVHWLNADDKAILNFFCYFKEDEPITDGKDNIPYLDQACTITTDSFGLQVPGFEVYDHTYEPIEPTCPSCGNNKSNPKRLVEANWYGRLNHYCQDDFHDGFKR